MAIRLIERFGIGQVAVSPVSRALRRTIAFRRSAAAAPTPAPWQSPRRFKADRCDIYTDVDGVYTTDPRIEPKAKRLAKVSFEEMLEMASLGAKVLQVRSVELAMVHNVRTFVRSSFEAPDAPGMDDFDNPPGTLICDEDEIVEKQNVTGIAYTRDEAQISLRRVQDRPGVSAAIFGPLAEAGINVDMIVQNVSGDGKFTDMTFTVPASDIDKAVRALERSRTRSATIACPVGNRTSSRSR
jgi:aspartate kinase